MFKKLLGKMYRPSPHLDLDPKGWEAVRLHDVICASEEFLSELRGVGPNMKMDNVEKCLEYMTLTLGLTHWTQKLMYSLRFSYLEAIYKEFGRVKAVEFIVNKISPLLRSGAGGARIYLQNNRIDSSLCTTIFSQGLRQASEYEFLVSPREKLPLLFSSFSRETHLNYIYEHTFMIWAHLNNFIIVTSCHSEGPFFQHLDLQEEPVSDSTLLIIDNSLDSYSSYVPVPSF